MQPRPLKDKCNAIKPPVADCVHLLLAYSLADLCMYTVS